MKIVTSPKLVVKVYADGIRRRFYNLYFVGTTPVLLLPFPLSHPFATLLAFPSFCYPSSPFSTLPASSSCCYPPHESTPWVQLSRSLHVFPHVRSNPPELPIMPFHPSKTGSTPPGSLDSYEPFRAFQTPDHQPTSAVSSYFSLVNPDGVAAVGINTWTGGVKVPISSWKVHQRAQS